MSNPRLVIQAGHVAPRESGFEAGTGTVKEQELAAEIQTRLAKLLEKDGRWTVTLCGGRTPDPRPFECDVFLSLHGDGSASSTSSGYCYGYPDANSGAFAGLLAREYEKLKGHPLRRKDNYTRDLAGYYGFSSRRVKSPVKVLVEHGFLTNPSERVWLFANTQRIAEAHYRALCRLFNRRATALAKPKPKVRVDVFVDDVRINADQDIDNPAWRARLLRALRRSTTKVVRIVRRQSA